MKGNELAAAIKLAAPTLPILMITASERARREPANPVDALMNKPFIVTELHSALRKVLSMRPAPAQREAVPNVESPSANFVQEPQAVPHL
jgi:CheY-like chemotaxis protein